MTKPGKCPKCGKQFRRVRIGARKNNKGVMIYYKEYIHPGESKMLMGFKVPINFSCWERIEDVIGKDT